MRSEEEIQKEIIEWKQKVNLYHSLYKKKPENRLKVNSREKVRKAIKSGILKRGFCICGSSQVEAHHEDYNKPLEIIWLCKRHHVEKTYPSASIDKTAIPTSNI